MDQSPSPEAEQLFLDALELEPSGRAAFVERACLGNEALRREVESLLEASEAASEYFGRLPDRLGIAGLASGAAGGEDAKRQVTGEAGQQFGQYTLTRLVGSGGMGTVWRAERSDGRFEGEVAVKLLSRGAGRAAPGRFALEGRYLARLRHPNIARLLDAGVGPEDQPFLVLEFVNGLPIDQYCDERALNIEERIRLFLAVLDAVAHAHAHLIVHRDIKPSNVQVDADGTVKLLDFGVAKLLGEDSPAGGSTLTREMGAALTPEFAAPEQLDGENVTTATDVYSLGLLLWLLVTGTNARNTSQLGSMAELRALAQKEPTRLLDAVTGEPSLEQLARLAERRNTSSPALLRTLRSDLDNIVRKALAVEPADRYETVADFGQDLTRYLRDEPVTAQAQTIAYRAQKFLRRHRGGVLAASLTLLALVSAAAITTWQSIEARHQRDAAVYQQQRLQATNEFLTFLFEDIGPEGKPVGIAELLDRGVSVLDRQYGSGQRFAGATYYDIANRYAGIDQVERAVELLGRAETIARAENDSDLLAATLCARAIQVYRSDPAAARAMVEEALTLRGGRGAAPSPETQVTCARAEAIMLELESQPDAALGVLQATFDRYSENAFPSPHTQGLLLNDIAHMHLKMGRLDLSLGELDRILELQRASGRGDTVGYLIVSLNRAVLLQSVGEIVPSIEARQSLIERVQELEDAGRSPPGFWLGYASSLVRLGRYDEMLGILEKSRASARDGGDEVALAEIDILTGRALVALGRVEEAIPYLDRSEEFMQRAPGVGARALRTIELTRVKGHLGQGDVTAAARVMDELLGGMSSAPASDRMHALRFAADVAIAAREPGKAEALASESLGLAVATARDPAMSADVGLALLLRAKARQMSGDAAGAASDLEAALPSLTNGLGEEHPETVAARELLGMP